MCDFHKKIVTFILKFRADKNAREIFIQKSFEIAKSSFCYFSRFDFSLQKWSKVCIVINMNRDKLLVGFLTAIIGLLLLLTPEAFAKFSVILLGAASILNGILILWTTRNLIYDTLYNRLVWIRGILSIVVGFSAVLFPIAFAHQVLRVLAYLLAIYLILSAAILSFTAFKLKRNGISVKNSFVEIGVSILLAALLFIILTLISPENVGMTIIYVFGGILVLSGLGLVFIQWKSRPAAIVIPPQDYVEHAIVPAEENPSEPKEKL